MNGFRARKLASVMLGAMIAWLIAPSVEADVRFSLSDGRVVIVAKDASVAEILAEWSRIGQTAIENADQLPSEHVTLELRNVREADALAVLLRAARAYIARTRAAADPNASLFERIVIVKLSAVQPPPEPSAVRAAMPPVSPVVSREEMFSMPFVPRRAPTDDDPTPPAASPIALVQPRDARPAAAEIPSDANASEPSPQVVAIDPEEMRAIEAAQGTHAARRALEVANPRDFHLPSPARGAGPRAPAPKRP